MLQRVHKPIQVIRVNKLYQSQSPPEIKISERLKETLSKERTMKAYRVTSQWWTITQWFCI